MMAEIDYICQWLQLKLSGQLGEVLSPWDLLPCENRPDLVKVILWYYQTAADCQRILSILPENGISWVLQYPIAMALGFLVKRYSFYSRLVFFKKNKNRPLAVQRILADQLNRVILQAFVLYFSLLSCLVSNPNF